MTRHTQIQDLLNQATAAAREKRFEQARRLIHKVLETQPDNLRALDLGGFVYFFEERYAQAEQFCRRALQLAPDHAYAHKGLGLCLARQDRLDEGIEELERAISLKPAWADPYWDMAVVLSENGRTDEALAVLERAQLAVPPSDVARFVALARKLRKKHPITSRGEDGAML